MNANVYIVNRLPSARPDFPAHRAERVNNDVVGASLNEETAKHATNTIFSLSEKEVSEIHQTMWTWT